jgi:glycosyltransferase involved in cell wall biosynthesis
MQRTVPRANPSQRLPGEVDRLHPAIVVAQIGARMHYAVPELLHRVGVLKQLFTDVYSGQGSWLAQVVRFIPPHFQVGALKRLVLRKANLPGHKVTAYNGLGLFWLAEHTWRQKTYAALPEFYQRQGTRFGEKIISSGSLKGASAIYGFTGSSLALFKFGKRSGLFRICEQMSAPIPERHKQYSLVAKARPNWQKNSLPNEFNHLSATIESQEWELADIILAPSPYIRTTLLEAGVDPRKIVLLPYGISLENFKSKESDFSSSRALRILFVGAVNIGKGVPHLLEAIRGLKPGTAEARLVGKVEIRSEKLRPYREKATFLGHISRQDVLKQYAWADVLVMPSVSEGSATVTYEALASGLPLIATWNSGAWVKDGCNGFIIPVRDSQTLAGRLEQLCQNPNLVHEMSQAAAASANHFSWAAYERRLLAVVDALHKNEMENIEDKLNLPFIPEKMA